MDTPPFGTVSKLEKVNSVASANELLGLGWALVAVHKRLFGSGSDRIAGDEYACFILGWTKATSPVYPKFLDREGIDE